MPRGHVAGGKGSCGCGAPLLAEPGTGWMAGVLWGETVRSLFWSSQVAAVMGKATHARGQLRLHRQVQRPARAWCQGACVASVRCGQRRVCGGDAGRSCRNRARRSVACVTPSLCCALCALCQRLLADGFCVPCSSAQPPEAVRRLPAQVPPVVPVEVNAHAGSLRYRCWVAVPALAAALWAASFAVAILL